MASNSHCQDGHQNNTIDPDSTITQFDDGPMRLCDNCIKIVEFIKRTNLNLHKPRTSKTKFKQPDVLDHSFPEFDEHCNLCQTIYGRLSSEELAGIKAVGLIHVDIRCRDIKAGSGDLEVKFNSRISGVYPTIIKNSPRHKIAESTNSESTWNMARSWLSTCKSTHICATSSHEAPRMPTRLVYLGDSELELQPRLRESKEILEIIDYCTLSHCWGKVKMTILEKSNYSQFLQSIPLKSLTQTFQDAMFAARKLGFQYIWIDSLCIIQHDVQDWQREALTMSSVYSMSSLNLAATSGLDGSAGLFHKRNPHSVRFPEISLPVLFSDKGKSILQDTTYVMSNPDLWREEITESILETRGWILQERYLAPRILHFGRNQIFWECDEWETSESFVAAGIEPPINTLSLRRARLSKYNDYVDHYDLWNRILTAYSTTYLTNRNDKLVALSGIAKSIQKPTGDRYLAGIWRKHLERDIMWWSETREGQAPPDPNQSIEYRAPSWSWASADGIICYSGFKRLDFPQPVISILDCDTTPLDGTDIFGQITSGYITVECLQLKDSTNIAYLEQQPSFSYMLDADIEGLTRGYLAWTLYNMGFKVYLLLVQMVVTPRPYEMTTVEVQDTLSTVYSTFGVGEKAPPGLRMERFEGLFLKVANTGRGEFERIGMFMMSAWSPNHLSPYARDGLADFMSLPGLDDPEAYLETPASPSLRGYRIKIV